MGLYPELQSKVLPSPFTLIYHYTIYSYITSRVWSNDDKFAKMESVNDDKNEKKRSSHVEKIENHERIYTACMNRNRTENKQDGRKRATAKNTDNVLGIHWENRRKKRRRR